MNSFEWLYSLHAGDQLLLSNSLVFLLVEADDGPDLGYAHYYGDLVGIHRDGTSRPDRAWLPTRRGRRATFHQFAFVRVGPDLSITPAARPRPASPESYAGYVRSLDETVARALSNAADPGRRQRYRPVVTLSRGYDSPAVAVIARRAGAREAVTFDGARGMGDADNGKIIGDRLGLEVTEYPHLAYRDLPGTPEAEACLADWGVNAPFAAMEPQLTGGIMVSGRRGDLAWGTGPIQGLARYPEANATGGSSMLELRLRTGFAHLSLPEIFSQDARPLRRLSRSADMRPWSIGGDYDRPIPRRILEEAGIPRHWFGQRKADAAHFPFQVIDPSRASHQELLRFVDDLPRDVLGMLKSKVLYRIHRVDARVSRMAERLLRPLHDDLRLVPSLPFRWRRPRRREDWAFHWGFEKLRCRYLPAGRDAPVA